MAPIRYGFDDAERRRLPQGVFAAEHDCPFRLNRDKWQAHQRANFWQGGFYFEVLVRAGDDQRFWKTDRVVQIDFMGVPFSFTTTACDESVAVLEQWDDAFTVSVAAQDRMVVNNRFGCAVQSEAIETDLSTWW